MATNTSERRAVAHFIRYQFPTYDRDQGFLVPEVGLLYSVFEQAVLNANVPEAARYLEQKEIPLLALCGMSTQWVQKVLRRAGILPEKVNGH